LAVELILVVKDPQPDVHEDQARAALSSEADALFSCLGFDDLVALDRQRGSTGSRR
jgi:hypothetical protein